MNSHWTKTYHKLEQHEMKGRSETILNNNKIIDSEQRYQQTNLLVKPHVDIRRRKAKVAGCILFHNQD